SQEKRSRQIRVCEQGLGLSRFDPLSSFLVFSVPRCLCGSNSFGTDAMLIFDAHLDLAWNALDWNRDLRLPAADIRRREREQGMTEKGRGVNTVSFAELRRGGVGIFIATLLARLLRANLMPAIQRYENMTAAYACAHGQMAYYRALEAEGYLRWITDWPSLRDHVRGWQEQPDKQPLGFILTMEGGDPVR